MADPTALTTTDLTDRLRDRIKNAIADLIPDAQWDAMLKKEVDAFFNVTHAGPIYATTARPSTFSTVLADVMEEEAKKRMRTYIETSPEWKERFSDTPGGGAIAPAIHQAFVDALPKMAAVAMDTLVNGVRQQILYALTQGR